MINKGICAFCGKEFDYVKREDGKGYYKRKYCSKDCEKAKWAKELEDKYAWTTCEYCGKKFKREKKSSGRGYKERKFCSIDCENKHYREISEDNYGWGICVICGKKFKRERVKHGYFSKTLFCSDNCKEKYADEKYPNRIQICAYCGKRIEYKTTRKDGSVYYKTKNKFCNSTCEQKYFIEVYGKKQCKQCNKIFYRPVYINTKGYREYKHGFKYDYCDECRQNLPRTSEAEQNFALLLQKNNIDYDIAEFNIDNFYYDFHISNYNILIDVNPSFTHTIKETYLNSGKSKDYHYNRVETATKAGYLYICIWDWSDVQNVIQIIKQELKRNIKYTIKEHSQPNLVYCKSHTNILVSENEAKTNSQSEYDYLPIYDCGCYTYNEINYTFS